MRLLTLTIEDFGPYYGPQRLSFERDRGVWIIYGHNGRGKTTLLNAFRYALYGKVLGRKAERDPRDVGNRAHRQQGNPSEFKTVLEFEHDGANYKLTRQFNEAHDPQHLVVLERDAVALNDEETERELSRIAPESLSQFFLFDGELLRQYEDLRDPEVDSGRRMRKEVDRLLGVQALESTIKDLEDLSGALTKEKAKQLAGVSRAAGLATALQEASDQRTRLSQSKSTLTTSLNEHRRRLGDVEEALGRHEAAQQIFGQLDQARQQLTDLQIRRTQARDELLEVAEDAWRCVLAPIIRSQLEDVGEALDRSKERRAEIIVHRQAKHHLEERQDCPVCERDLDEGARQALLSRAASAGADDVLEELDRVVGGLQSRMTLLAGLRDAAQPALLAERDRSLRRTELMIEELKDDIEELEERLKGVDEAGVRKRQRERDNLNKLIAQALKDIEETEEKIQQQDAAITNIKERLAQEHVTADPASELKEEVVSKLHDLYSASLARYQEQLLERVEEEASKIFGQIRSETDFARLRIRDGYGLSIVDDDGAEVTGHSAGYEHLIALSLITALQRCSPVQGPIVMDSPFGRLDEVHTKQVVAALPQIADQVILLAFQGEFDRDAAVGALGTALSREYILERVSSKHTTITVREEQS
jgi:DNA sulfur modification protein DndD